MPGSGSSAAASGGIASGISSFLGKPGVAGGLGALGSLLGGGGGPGYENKDVSGNIKSADQTFGTATDYGAQTFGAAKGLNDEAHRNLRSVTGAELPMMDNVNNVARGNFDTYQNTFQPLQAQQAQQAKEYTSGENIDRMRGRAVADSNSAQQAGRQNAAAALAAEGVDPASIHGGALDRQASIMGAAQNAGAANNSYLQTMDTGRAMVNQANQLGLEVGQQGINTAQAGSNIGNSLVNAETSANTGSINNLQGANTYLNTAVNANKSSADIAHQANQDEAARAAAASSSSGGFGGLVSSLAPLAMAAMEKGGPVPHRGALPVPPIPGSTDTVPMLATPGEFVIPQDVVNHKGNEFFHKLIDSTRVKMNERRAIPKQVYAHKSNH